MDTSPEASLARRAARNTIARELAVKRYANDDVEVSDDLDYVDGGYWVRARVWVDAQDVEDVLDPA